MFLLSYYSTGVIAEFCLESVVAAHTAIECPAPQPIRRGLRPETNCGWKTSVCEPSPHIPCSFQPQERRHPPEKERGHGSVELTGERQGCSTVPCRIKIRSLERINKVWVQRTENTQSHTNTHTRSLSVPKTDTQPVIKPPCSSQLVRCWWVWSGPHHRGDTCHGNTVT